MISRYLPIPHYDDACRKFALAHNKEDVAKQSGIRAQTLRNKLNPDQPHQLTVLEVLALTDVTEDATLVDGLLAQIQCLPYVPVNEVANEKFPLYVMKATAEVGQLAAGAISKEPMTANCKRDLLQNVNSSIRCSGRLLLSTQADACARHNHYIRTPSSVTLITDGSHPARGQIQGSVNTAGTAVSGKSVGITGGSENRPRNVAFNYIVRAA